MWSLLAEVIVLGITILAVCCVLSLALTQNTASIELCPVAKCILALSKSNIVARVVTPDGRPIIEYAYLYIYNYTSGNYRVLRILVPENISISNVENCLVILLTPECFNYTRVRLPKSFGKIYVTPCGIYRVLPSAACSPIVICQRDSHGYASCRFLQGSIARSTCSVEAPYGLLWLGRLIKIVIHR